jgi:hypothetical protein
LKRSWAKDRNQIAAIWVLMSVEERDKIIQRATGDKLPKDSNDKVDILIHSAFYIREAYVNHSTTVI